MAIFFDEKQNIFHIKTPKTSYIMHIWRGKDLAHVYWGKKIKTPDLENSLISRVTGFSPVTDKEDYTLDFLCQEYPTGCGSDYRMPAISVVFEDGSRNPRLVYDGHRIYKGKPKLQGLPATYVEKDEEADTLEITLTDKLKGLQVVLSYTAYNEIDAITRSVKVINESTETIILENSFSKYWCTYVNGCM